MKGETALRALGRAAAVLKQEAQLLDLKWRHPAQSFHVLSPVTCKLAREAREA